MDSLPVSRVSRLDFTVHSPIVRSSDGFGQDWRDVNETKSSVGSIDSVRLVNRVGNDELLDWKIFQIVHGGFGQ